jgi:hypothetical protein
MKLTLEINCGKNTCASKPGEFCHFCSANGTGSKIFCDLFKKSLYDETGDVRGWIQRCKECKEAENE